MKRPNHKLKNVVAVSSLVLAIAAALPSQAATINSSLVYTFVGNGAFGSSNGSIGSNGGDNNTFSTGVDAGSTWRGAVRFNVGNILNADGADDLEGISDLSNLDVDFTLTVAAVGSGNSASYLPLFTIASGALDNTNAALQGFLSSLDTAGTSWTLIDNDTSSSVTVGDQFIFSATGIDLSNAGDNSYELVVGFTGNEDAEPNEFIQFAPANNSITVVPEPGSLALLGLGGFCLASRRRRTH